MSFLKDVKVSKVSFVRKAANKRKFLLLKSDDAVVDDVGVINKNEEYKPMRKEVRDKLILTLKAAENVSKSAADVVNILKADAELKLSDSEIVEIADFLDLEKAVKEAKDEKPGDKPNDNEPDNDEDDEDEMKKEEHEKLMQEVADLRKSLEAANTTISSITKDTQRREVLSFLTKECAFAPGDIQKHADTIMDLAKVAPSAAEEYKNTLKVTSANIEQSNLFKEIGNSTDELLKAESDGFDLIRKFDAAFNDIKKSANGATPDAASIVNLVKSFGNQYNDYRVSHILRAKREGI